eukprot:scaffold156177_cov31-Tisochrysis_lutea.AAC.7
MSTLAEAMAVDAAAVTASRTSRDSLMSRLAPTSSSRSAIATAEVPAAIATYGTASRLAAWIHTTASSPFRRRMATRGAATPSRMRCSAHAARTERISRSRRVRVEWVPSGGS